MFNSFFMEATRIVWIAVVAPAKPPFRPVLALPAIVAGSAHTKKRRPKQRWREGIPKVRNDAASNENKLLHLEVR